MQSIYYFTRTGASRRIARALSEGLGAPCYEITDGNNYRGIVGYLRGGYYAARGVKVGISVTREPLKDERIYLVGPVWASAPAPALKAFRAAYPENTMVLILNDLGQPLEKLKAIQEGYEKVYLINHRLRREDKDIEAVILGESL
ncbi:MAG: hypothetical protein AVO33_01615 [delta proteobacterium ML8_F1]|nr:MAG: hypothetical protein AVO33_01615 [delta proteobacterium ML8_F1]